MKYNLKKKNIISSKLERVTPQFANRFIILHIISKEINRNIIEFTFIIYLVLIKRKKFFFLNEIGCFKTK